jgi:hypothetical protein
MKAEWGSDGLIRIKPETHVEAYALKKWCEENVFTSADTSWTTTKNLLIHTSIDDGPVQISD